MSRIERATSIENLINKFPGAVHFLIQKSLPCLVCGEPSWGTLEELARDKGWSDAAIDELVRQMNQELVTEKQ